MEQKIDQILKTVTDTQTDIKSIQAELSLLKVENKELKQKICQLQTKFNKLDIASRQNDIIIYGVEETENENFTELQEKVIWFTTTFLNISLSLSDFQTVKRIGRNPNTRRPVLLKLLRQNNKLELWNNRRLLKNSGYAISENYTEETMETVKKLKPYLAEARSQGKHAVIRSNKLIIDNKKYTLEELDEIQNTTKPHTEQRQGHTRKHNSKKEGPSGNLRNK